MKLLRSAPDCNGAYIGNLPGHHEPHIYQPRLLSPVGICPGWSYGDHWVSTMVAEILAWPARHGAPAARVEITPWLHAELRRVTVPDLGEDPSGPVETLFGVRVKIVDGVPIAGHFRLVEAERVTSEWSPWGPG